MRRTGGRFIFEQRLWRFDTLRSLRYRATLVFPMSQSSPEQVDVLRDYADGLLGTRETIEISGLGDFADLIIALAQHNLPLPKPADTPQRRASLEQARTLLQPRLRADAH